MARRFQGADGIRACACLIVLILHSVVLLYQGLHGYLIGLPKLGVWIFFVLSAFLLTVKFEADGFQPKALCSYVIGRILRILPLYILFVVVYRYVGTAGINSDADMWMALSLQGGYSHLWTIPVEFKYYLFLPAVSFVALWCRNSYGYGCAVAVGVLMILLQQAIWPYWDTPTVTTDVYWYFSCFTIGTFAAVILPAVSPLINANRADLLVTVLLVSAVVISPYFQYKVFGIVPSDYLVNKFVFLSFGCAVLTLSLISGAGFYGRILSSRLFTLIGKWSYSIYLVHWLIIVKVYDYLPYSVWGVLTATIISVIAGGLIHHVLERPIENVRHKLMSRIS